MAQCAGPLPQTVGLIVSPANILDKPVKISFRFSPRARQ